MKKLLCLLVITTLITGCTSNSSSKEKEDDKKISETSKVDDKRNDEDKKEETETVTDNEDNSTSSQETEVKNDSSSVNKNNTNNTQANSGNSSGNSNGNSNAGGSTTPPKQETPTPPTQVEIPPAPATPTEQRGKADSVMAQINAYRQQNGKPAFVITDYLLNSSSQHAYAMAEKRALWHSGAAECITNYDDPFSAWVNSPEHNKLLLCNNETGAVSIYYVDGYYFSVFQTLP